MNPESRASEGSLPNPIRNAENRCRVLFAVMSVLAVFSLMVDLSALASVKSVSDGFRGLVQLLRLELKAVTLEAILASVLVAALLYAVLFPYRRKPSSGSVILSILFSLFLVFGECFRYCGSFSAMFIAPQQTAILVFVTLGYGAIFYSCMEMMAVALPRLLEAGRKKQTGCDPRFYWKAFGLLLLCWVLFSLPFFPGSVPHDGRRQLLMFDGYTGMTNSHPYISTILLGAAAALGRVLFGAEYGVLLVVICQMLLGAFVFASISDAVRIHLSKTAAKLTILFYALCPLWWTYMESVMKDTVFFVAFSWLTLLCFELFWGIPRKYPLPQMVIASFLSCGFRHEGIYYVVLLLALTVLLTKSCRKILLAALAIAIAMGVTIEAFAAFGVKLEKENPLEQLSIPVQQVARVIQQCGEEITEEELYIVDQIFNVEGVQDRYNPELSDPVKNRYRSISEEDWDAFWALYRSWAKKYTAVYVEAIAGESFGYFDPLYFYNGMRKYQQYNKEFLTESDKGVVYSQYLISLETQNTIYNALCTFDNIPIVSLTVNPAAYVWLVLAMLLWGPWKRAKGFLLVPLVNFVICIFSPVNGFMRYMLPIAASMPLYITLMLKDVGRSCAETAPAPQEQAP